MGMATQGRWPVMQSNGYTQACSRRADESQMLSQESSMQAFNQATGTCDFVIAVLFACMFLVFNNAPAQTVSVDPSTAGSASSNILPITIDKGLTNAGANRLYVTITVCMPGSTTN